ncbi:MAG: hypothetical protein S4CHLAM81_03290 [Chlamydiales bacterium]|nr:hypothetical protein [Chlamydiales bacterium]MCH9635119.1 hypothetical protein [Chlamydiales bacterium]
MITFCHNTPLYHRVAQHHETIKSVAIGALVGVVCLAVVAGVSYGISKRFPNLKVTQGSTHLMNLFQKVPVLHTVWKLIWRTIIVVGAPVFEETVFRGFLNKKIEQWTGDNSRVKKVSRVLLVALIFGVAHLSPYQSAISNAVIVGTTAALGLVFGLLREARKDLVSPIAAHAIYNLGAVL